MQSDLQFVTVLGDIMNELWKSLLIGAAVLLSISGLIFFVPVVIEVIASVLVFVIASFVVGMILREVYHDTFRS